MLNTNLSTRPFYNERAVQFAILAIAFVVAVFTSFNAVRIVTLSKRNTELTREATLQEQQARQLELGATQVRTRIDEKGLKTLAAEAADANAIIDQRTFSWTEVFNRIEATIPADVMIKSVRPDVKDGVINVSILVEGKRVEDIDTFMEGLEGTGAFKGLLSRQEQAVEETGSYTAELRGRYVQAVVTPEVAPASAQSGAGR